MAPAESRFRNFNHSLPTDPLLDLVIEDFGMRAGVAGDLGF